MNIKAKLNVFLPIRKQNRESFCQTLFFLTKAITSMGKKLVVQMKLCVIGVSFGSSMCNLRRNTNKSRKLILLMRMKSSQMEHVLNVGW